MRFIAAIGFLSLAHVVFAQGAPDGAPTAVPQAVLALRHLQPTPNSGPYSWTNGPYTYDGAGNITAIGSEQFVYDKVGRLRTATVRGPDLSATQTQTFDYDEYGNLIQTAKLGQTVMLTTSTATNRLGALSYDAAGNVTAAGAENFEYDAVGMMSQVRVGTSLAPRIIYAYTANDERLFAFDVPANTTHWTLRGLDNKVLRDFKQTGASWSVERDYVYRDGLLLAALKPGGAVEHYSLDHLGTPRLVTDGAGQKIGYHVYWPYGEEWSAGNAQDGSPLKFTGHERDGDPTGGNATLDYMHARYYGAEWGRFLSVDPVLDSKRALQHPQAWNRYAYVEHDPIVLTDADGRCPACALIIAIVGGLFLSGDVANAPAPGDKLYPNEGPASAIRGAMIGLGLYGSGNAVTQGITSLLRRDGSGSTSEGPAPAVQRSGERFFNKAPKGSENFTTEVQPDGSTKFSYETPGKVPGSKAIYEKIVDSAGKTTEVTKTTLDPMGNVVSVKDKLVPKP